MLVEITGFSFSDGELLITGIDVSEENLIWIERRRDDGFEKEVEFLWTRENLSDLRSWLKQQKRTRGAKTYREAVESIVGTITDVDRRRRIWS